MNSEREAKLLAASGYLDLGMHLEAWDEPETLQPDERVSNEVIQLRIEIPHRLEK